MMGATAKLSTAPLGEVVNRRGPKTVAGKRNSSMNATRHGMFSQREVLPWEDQDEYDEHVADTLEFFAVNTAYEERHVRQLALLQWKQKRLDAYADALAVEAAFSRHGEGNPGDSRSIEDAPPGEIRALVDRCEELQEQTRNSLEAATKALEKPGKPMIKAESVREAIKALRVAEKLASTFADDSERENPFTLPGRFKSILNEAGPFIVLVPQDVQGVYSTGRVKIRRRILTGIEGALHALNAALEEQHDVLTKALEAAETRESFTRRLGPAMAAIPRKEQLDLINRYQRSIERSIREVLGQLAVSRKLKEAIERSPPIPLMPIPNRKRTRS